MFKQLAMIPAILPDPMIIELDDSTSNHTRYRLELYRYYDNSLRISLGVASTTVVIHCFRELLDQIGIYSDAAYYISLGTTIGLDRLFIRANRRDLLSSGCFKSKDPTFVLDESSIFSRWGIPLIVATVPLMMLFGRSASSFDNDFFGATDVLQNPRAGRSDFIFGFVGFLGGYLMNLFHLIMNPNDRVPNLSSNEYGRDVFLVQPNRVLFAGFMLLLPFVGPALVTRLAYFTYKIPIKSSLLRGLFCVIPSILASIPTHVFVTKSAHGLNPFSKNEYDRFKTNMKELESEMRLHPTQSTHSQSLVEFQTHRTESMEQQFNRSLHRRNGAMVTIMTLLAFLLFDNQVEYSYYIVLGFGLLMAYLNHRHSASSFMSFSEPDSLSHTSSVKIDSHPIP